MPSAAFLAEMERKRGSQPLSKIEFITKNGTVTDISRYYLAGGNLQSVRERAPDEIQAGQFDIVLSNHDDAFSEFKVGSLLYASDYHGARIRISEGFVLPDGSTEFLTQGVGYIDSLSTDTTKSSVTLRCRDLLWRIMDMKLHVRPNSEIPVAAQTNVGNGIVSTVNVAPFTAKTETWTLTCTTPGVDGTAVFSVVGSISGNVGNATSGSDFQSLTGGVKFKIEDAVIPWAVGDKFTFQSNEVPRWEYVNAGKIIWSIFTGYNWDTDTPEPWADFVFDYDHTKSSANVDLDYDSFEDSIAKIQLLTLYDLKGFIPYDTDAIQLLQGILLLFLGSIYTGNDGRIRLRTYIPIIGTTYRTFSDAKKVTELQLTRTIDEVINSVVVTFKQSDDWPWSNEAVALDGIYSKEDVISISKYKRLGMSYEVPWKTTHNTHVQDFADKLLAKFNAPPLNLDFTTGMDALLTEIGDRVVLTDEKLGITGLIGEVAMVSKQFDKRPTAIALRLRKDSEIAESFGFIGSEVDEGDGISPQSDDYDTASSVDKEFAYFSKSGETVPDYRIF